jgi:hypothetical protein
MRSVKRRVTALTVMLGLVGLVGASMPASASASNRLAIDWFVSARTHIEKLDSDVSVPGGKFSGSIDLESGRLTGNLSLPPATVTMSLLDAVPAVDATFEISPVGPTTGTVDFSTFQVSTKSTFDIRVTKVTPHGSDVNLVGDDCRTATPITVRMGGVADLEQGSTFSGQYTIPDFEGCQGAELALNEMIPGSGNTFTATFAPDAPPPAPQPEPGPAPAPPPPAATGQGGVHLEAGDQIIDAPLDFQAPVPSPLPSNDGPSPVGGGNVVGVPVPPLFTTG